MPALRPKGTLFSKNEANCLQKNLAYHEINGFTDFQIPRLTTKLTSRFPKSLCEVEQVGLEVLRITDSLEKVLGSLDQISTVQQHFDEIEKVRFFRIITK